MEDWWAWMIKALFFRISEDLPTAFVNALGSHCDTVTK